MNDISNCRRMILSMVLLAAMTFCAQAASEPKYALSEIPDPVAVVNGEPISRDMFISRLVEYHGVYVLENLIGETLLLAEAEKKGAAVTKVEVDQRVQEKRETAKVPSDEAFRSLLLQNEYTEARYRDEARLSLLAEKTFADIATVNETELAEYYNKSKTNFKIPRSAKVKFLTASTEQMAKKAMELLNSGKSLVEVKQELAMGMIQTPDEAVTVLMDNIAPWLQREIERAPLNRPYGPVKISQDPQDPESPAIGYQVFIVESRVAERQRPFEEVKEDIRTAIFRERMYGAYGVWNRWLSSTRRSAVVKRNLEFTGEPTVLEERLGNSAE